jgi:hypothetical protein
MKKASYLFVALAAFSLPALAPNVEARPFGLRGKPAAETKINTPCETGRVSYYPNGPVERCILAQPHTFAVGLSQEDKTTINLNCNAVGFHPNGNLKFCDLLAGGLNRISIAVNGISTTCPDGIGRVLISENGYISLPRWCIRAE